MKRGLLTAMGAVTALALAVPGAALAHQGRGHHHHRGRAHAHHAKFRLLHVGAPTPTTTPTPPTPENAGTVASYTGGVLTLTLKDGSVSGKVTNETRIECVKTMPSPPVAAPGDGKGPGNDDGPGDDGDRGEMGDGNHDWGGWRHGNDGEPGAREPEPPCDSSALVTGATVRAAELRIGPQGNEFESVWLVH